MHSTIDNNEWYLACPDCDLLMPKIRPPKGQKNVCPRCGRVLLRHCIQTVTRSLALALAGLLLYFPSIFLPLMTFRKLGLSESGNILETILAFVHKEYYIVAVVVFFSTVIFPLVKLSLLITLSLCLKLQRYPRCLGNFFRFYNRLDEWAMVEVYLLGIMITIVKMNHSTEISFNLGFFCFIGLVLITIASSLTVCKESFWLLIDSKGKFALQQFHKAKPSEFLSSFQTAKSNNLMLCHDCGKLSQEIPENSNPEEKHYCNRCGAQLHFRKPTSISKTWALIITAILLLFPANLLPIMRVEFLGMPSSSTILDGIRLFFQDGSYIIALIILTASILIPIFKIVGLAIVLLTIKYKRQKYLRQKTIMYRFIEFIGRWSMLDIFVIALLGHFVNFGFLTSIETAPAATYFCLVVITTMFATLTFDPRLMWDMLSTETQQQKSTK